MRRKLLAVVAIVACLCASFAAAFVATPAASAQGQTECVLIAVPGPEDPPPVATAAPSPTAVANETDEASAQAVFASAEASTVLSAADCADALAYPGPFTNMPPAPRSPYAAPLVLRPAPGVEADTAPAPTAADLAHSGSESFILAYIGTGLVAFGAVALGSRRRLFVE